VRNADKIVVIADHGIQAMGTHDELMTSSTHYADLVKRQLNHKRATTHDDDDDGTNNNNGGGGGSDAVVAAGASGGKKDGDGGASDGGSGESNGDWAVDALEGGGTQQATITIKGRVSTGGAEVKV
jgi:hypothetical protein